MHPIEFPEQNFVFIKPANMTDEQCESLPVCKILDTEGTPLIISKWELNYEELQLIQKTGCIYVSVVGTVTPPIGLTVETPFTTESP